jgi:hypothetical protein
VFEDGLEVPDGAELAKVEKMRNPIGFSAYPSRFGPPASIEINHGVYQILNK